MSDYLFDKTGSDPEVAELEELLGTYAHRAPLRAPPPRRRRWRTVAAAGAAVIVATTAILCWPRSPTAPASCAADGNGFAFSVAGGQASCNGGAAASGTLPVGAWLETSTAAVAELQLANIGELTVFGGSRVRLVGTGPREHRMELTRGRVAARVVAPPRLFVVDTPVATAVDLGCAYELSIDDGGRTHLRVTSGAVSLEGKGRVAYTPAGTEVIALPGVGPGTPVAVAAPAQLRAAVARFDSGDASAVSAIVAGAEMRDTITLWNLLPRTSAADRAAVMSRLEQLRGRPDGIGAAQILAGDRAALEAWRQALESDWGVHSGKRKSSD
jgi:FecR protein